MYYQESLVVPTRMALLGIAVGAVAGLVVAQFNPGPTLAAVVANPPLSIGKPLDQHLARFDDNYFAIANTPDVSLTPESASTVRKIGYGRTHFVEVATTATGTYSTDGLASPNVRYPGIFKEPLHLLPLPFEGSILGWSNLSGWLKIPLVSANSFSFLDDYSVPASQHGVCVLDNATGDCR
jgi:hypothetical protein